MEKCKRNAIAADIEASSTSFSCKRTKADRLVALELENPGCSSSRSPAMDISAMTSSGRSTTAVSVDDDQYLDFRSDCSSNESCEIVQDSLKYIDLEASSLETEISTGINKSSRETSSSSEIFEETVKMDSPQNNRPANARNHSRNYLAARMPSEVELDEFFSGAEKYEQKRFAEKYNYDIVKDAPLEGRYQWVRLNHEKERC